MSKSVHEQATEVIAKVLDLDTQEALSRIERECRSNPELKEAVLELYNNIKETDKSPLSNKSNTEHIQRLESTDNSTSLVFQQWIEKIFEKRSVRLIFLSISLFVLLVIGVGIRFQVRSLLINNTEKHLEDQLYTQQIRMQEWIYNGKTTIKALAEDPEIIDIAEKCIDFELLAPSLREFNRKEKYIEFLRQYKLAQSFTNVPAGIISKEGAKVVMPLYRLSDDNDSISGVRLAKGIYSAYLEAMEKTVYVKPLSEEETIYNLPDTSNSWISSLFLSPIKNERDELLGILYNSYLAKKDFSRILSDVHFGNTGETYAFDKRGRMLSSGRFVDELRENSFFEMAADDETIYNIILKNPGGDVFKGFKPKINKLQMPFVEPLQDLLIELEKANVDSLITRRSKRPYRNYRGKIVISSWMWWPKYEFGIITEVTLKEALTTLVFFDYAFAALYLIIFILSYLLFTSNVKIFRFGQKIKKYKLLGQYRLLEKIGEGGFGEVYKAEHAFLKTPVAVKLLKKKFNGTDMLERFEKEVKAISSLSNPNTIKIIDYGNTADGQFYYVMEYLNGISLEQLVLREQSIEVSRGVLILLSVCFSLKEAHDQGLIHRDIKPGNIMLCSQGGANDLIKVLDFGLVKSMGTVKADQTQINRIGGTPMFMAPERLRNPFNTDQRVDIYSIGALGIYMFSGKYILELVSQKMLSGEETIQREFKTQLIDRDDVPADLKEILMQCLSFETDKRPENINIVIEQLEKLQEKYPWTRNDAELWWKQYDVYQ